MVEKNQNITKIFGLRDEKIKSYLRSHPDVAKRLANTLISLESRRKKDNRLASAIGALGFWIHRWHGVSPDKEYFHQPKYLLVIILLSVVIFIFTITFLATLFYNI